MSNNIEDELFELILRQANSFVRFYSLKEHNIEELCGCVRACVSFDNHNIRIPTIFFIDINRSCPCLDHPSVNV